MSNTGSKTLPLYNRAPHVSFHGRVVYTNLPVAGAYRGYGGTQGAFALETAITTMIHQLKAIIEERMALGFSQMRIISSSKGQAVANALRAVGYAVTEMSGRGKDGMVNVLLVTVRRKEVDHVQDIVLQADESAFITIEEVRPLWRGFYRA